MAKIFQGTYDEGCEETDEVLILFNHKEIAAIIRVLQSVAGELPPHVNLTGKGLKAKAKKALAGGLNDVCCFPSNTKD